jgi:hypothetical protein
MIERVVFDNTEFAIIVRNGVSAQGVQFHTPSAYSQQLAVMRHPAGHVIPAHIHNNVARAVQYTQEALFVRHGRLRVNFYRPDGAILGSRDLGAGEVVLLIAGGHGFEVLEEVDMVEIKQGPYVGESDKTLLAATPRS